MDSPHPDREEVDKISFINMENNFNRTYSDHAFSSLIPPRFSPSLHPPNPHPFFHYLDNSQMNQKTSNKP